MTRWSQNEFEILVNGYGLSDEELKQRLPGRTCGAIAVVRNGIHSYHNEGKFISALSKMMLQYLKDKRGSLTCPKCGEKF